jgi:hypothetical protein
MVVGEQHQSDIDHRGRAGGDAGAPPEAREPVTLHVIPHLARHGLRRDADVSRRLVPDTKLASRPEGAPIGGNVGRNGRGVVGGEFLFLE